MQINGDAAGIGIETISRLRIADLADDLAGNVLVIHLSRGGHFPENMYLIGGTSDFACNVCGRILGEDSVQDAIRDLIAYLIRVSACYGLRRKIVYHMVLCSNTYALRSSGISSQSWSALPCQHSA